MGSKTIEEETADGEVVKTEPMENTQKKPSNRTNKKATKDGKKRSLERVDSTKNLLNHDGLNNQKDQKVVKKKQKKNAGKVK